MPAHIQIHINSTQDTSPEPLNPSRHSSSVYVRYQEVSTISLETEARTVQSFVDFMACQWPRSGSHIVEVPQMCYRCRSTRGSSHELSREIVNSLVNSNSFWRFFYWGCCLLTHTLFLSFSISILQGCEPHLPIWTERCGQYIVWCRWARGLAGSHICHSWEGSWRCYDATIARNDIKKVLVGLVEDDFLLSSLPFNEHELLIHVFDSFLKAYICCVNGASDGGK